MNQDYTPIHITEIYKIVHTHNIPASVIELHREIDDKATYLIDNKYMLKISTSTLEEQTKQARVKSIQLAPNIHASGVLSISGREYHYVIIDYVQVLELWSAAQSLTNKEKYNIGKEIAQFLNELHSLTGDCYDIGHYIPTIPCYKKSWEEGHLEYAAVLQDGISKLDLKPSSKKAIANAFEYIHSNIHTLKNQTGARLLHNDFHPKNIIVHKGRLAGVIDWECSQYGEADFDLSHLIHWCAYPMDRENNLEIVLKSVVENLQIASIIPDIEQRFTIYQLEHEINQLVWRGARQEKERIPRINGWLNGKMGAYL